MDAPPTLHPDLAELSGLVGTWSGNGEGEYPTIDPFSYREEISFNSVGKPFLHYLQRTWGPTGNPMHTETGFLRAPSPGVVELILAQPTGHTELCVGTLRRDDGVLILDLQATVAASGSAKPVESTRRRYELSGDNLVSSFAMAAVGVPMTHHLRTRFTRS